MPVWAMYAIVGLALLVLMLVLFAVKLYDDLQESKRREVEYLETISMWQAACGTQEEVYKKEVERLKLEAKTGQKIEKTLLH